MIEEGSENNTKLLAKLYHDHKTYCVEWLQMKYKCSKDDALDITMDAIITMYQQCLLNKYKDQNARGYLITIAKNKYLNVIKKSNKNIPFNINSVEYYINVKNGVYQDNFNPLLKNEEGNRLNRLEEIETNAYLHAWSLLNEKCKTLLERYYIKGEKLKDIHNSMNYNSYDTIKTTKSRCFIKLKTMAVKYLDTHK